MKIIRIQPIGSRVPPLPESRCPKRPYKRKFMTLEAAEAQASEWAYHNESRYRPYDCDYCDGFHLTKGDKP